MPFVAAAAAAAWSAATVFATTGSLTALAALGNTVIVGSFTLSQAVGVATTAASLYTATRKPKTSASAPSPVDLKADPNADLSFWLGRTGAAGNVAFHRTAGDKSKYLNYFGVLSAAGPMKTIQWFTANGEIVPFTSDQGFGATGRYKNRMWLRTQFGGPNEPALNIPATGSKDTPGDHGGNPVEWTAQHRLSGKAAYQWILEADTQVFSNGTPKPLFVGEGIRHYDRRRDSTAPGGSGPQRPDNPATWVYSENPYVVATTFLLGFYELNFTTGQWVRVGGVGVPPEAVDWDAFVHAANVADANGWTVSGIITSGMPKWATLATILQAGGGLPAHNGAQISCFINAPKVSTFTITSADLLGQAVVDAGALERDRINTGIPRWTQEALGWKPGPGGEVTDETYRQEDGEPRVREVNFDLVSQEKQAHELTAYFVAEQRELLSITVNVGPKFMDVHGGAAGTVIVPELGLNGLKVVVTRRRFDPKTWTLTFTLRSETDGKHPWALGQVSDAPASPTLTARDPANIPPPKPGRWTVDPTPVNPDGGQSPSVVFRPAPGVDSPLTDDDPAATSVVVRYRLIGTTNPWIMAEFPAPANSFPLAGQPGVYEVQIAYRVRGVVGAFQPYGTVTIPKIVASDTQAVAGTPAQDIADAFAVLDDIALGELGTLAETLVRYRDDLDDIISLLNTATGGQLGALGDRLKKFAETADDLAEAALNAAFQSKASTERLGESIVDEANIQKLVNGELVSQIEGVMVGLDEAFAQSIEERYARQAGDELQAIATSTVALQVADDRAAVTEEMSVERTERGLVAQRVEALAVETADGFAAALDYTRAVATGLETAVTHQETYAAEFGGSLALVGQRIEAVASLDAARASSTEMLVAARGAEIAAVEQRYSVEVTPLLAQASALEQVSATHSGNIADAMARITAAASAESASTARFEQLIAAAEGNLAIVLGQQTATADALGARASALEVLAVQSGASIAGISSRFDVEVGALSSRAGALEFLVAQTGNVAAGLEELRVVQTTDREARVQELLTLGAEVAANGAAIQQALSLILSTDAGQVSAREQVQLQVNGIAGEIDEVSSIVISPNGDLRLVKGVALNANGHVIGHYLRNDGTVGEAVWVVDKFMFVDPNNGSAFAPVSYQNNHLILDTRVFAKSIETDVITAKHIISNSIERNFALIDTSGRFLPTASGPPPPPPPPAPDDDTLGDTPPHWKFVQ